MTVRLWERRLVRRLTAILLFAAAVLLQVFFKNFPWPITVQTNDQLRNPTAALAQEEMVLKGTAVRAGNPLLSYEGNAREVADIDLERAQVDEQTARLAALSSQGPPPLTPGAWHYVTADRGDRKVEPCHTVVNIELQSGSAGAGEIHFFQLDQPGLDRFRGIELRADSAKLIVNAKTEPADSKHPGAFGCWKKIQGGEWQGPLVNNAPVQFTAEPNSTLRIKFVVAGANSSWGGPDKLFRSAQLGPISAREVTVRSIQEDGSSVKAPAALHLAAYRGSMLKIRDLEIGSASFQTAVTGKAWAEKDGKTLGFDVLDAMQKNMEFAALLTAANGILLAWLRKLFFGGREPPKAKQAASGSSVV